MIPYDRLIKIIYECLEQSIIVALTQQVMFEEFIVNRLADEQLLALENAMPWEGLRSKL